uniref:DUF3381 domain-containing protein n=1 Tax=Anisakis simplex TaxID=6269 RepID=A0A0M3JNC8_ANISI
LKFRCDELKVEGLAKKLDASESDSDSEFEDVPEKEGLELDFKPPDEVPDYILSRIKEIDQEAGPSTSGISSRLKKSSEAQGYTLCRLVIIEIPDLNCGV